MENKKLENKYELDKWWSVENLEEKERLIRSREKLQEHDLLNDFGSYKEINLSGDTSKSLIKHHNDIFPADKIKFISRSISNKKNIHRILDLGCGCGYTTHEISKQFKNAEVLGVDISLDAINFATKNFANGMVRFEKKSISTNNKNLDIYDIVFAFEFYPFSRSTDSEFQLELIQYLVMHLNKTGILVIYQAMSPRFYKNIRRIIKQNDYLKIRMLLIPNLKVLKILKIRYIAIIFCFLLNKIYRRNFVNLFVEIKLSNKL